MFVFLYWLRDECEWLNDCLMFCRLASLLPQHELSLPLKRWTFRSESRTLSCLTCRRSVALPANSDPNHPAVLNRDVVVPFVFRARHVLMLSLSSQLFPIFLLLCYIGNICNWSKAVTDSRIVTCMLSVLAVNISVILSQILWWRCHGFASSLISAYRMRR